jgi:hypothetical protein
MKPTMTSQERAQLIAAMQKCLADLQREIADLRERVTALETRLLLREQLERPE